MRSGFYGIQANKFQVLSLFLLWVSSADISLQAQSYKINLGPSKIGLNEVYTITLTALNAEPDNYSNFPNITGFSKAGTSSSSSMRSVNGQVTHETSIIQNYMPEKEGVFKLPPFQMKVNGAVLKSPGASITVGPPVEQKNTDPFGANPFAYDPFEDFFGGARSSELKNGKADAIFSSKLTKPKSGPERASMLPFRFWWQKKMQQNLNFTIWENNWPGSSKRPSHPTAGKKISELKK